MNCSWPNEELILRVARGSEELREKPQSG